jgi:hypothetical protein
VNPIFSILSAAYIAGIFLFADSPIVSAVAPFNPYNLLHIPLYGILTLFLIFSKRSSISINRGNSINPTNSSNSTNLLIAGVIAIIVAVADEIHQTYILTRSGSVGDVLLDVVGIMLCLFLFRWIKHVPWFSKTIDFLCQTTQQK